ncbi:hypothetical protein EC912_10780 [Luteibacter rhizovicinus]|uniref:Ig-like domain-containing protein n=1 Tax=Luteibacter rhizovicinus TaxID=242606 RepID=A0A4R3YND0_9GAMM|nr:hypothetical protein EC912_10780 [Luteibacter rhizovicinus]
MLMHRTMKGYFRSRFSFFFVATAGLLFAMLAVPASAHALSLAVCTGSHAATWSPGVTYATEGHTVTTDSQWTCVQLAAPVLTSASSHEQFTAQFSCGSLLTPAPATWTIKWADNVTSTFSFTSTVNAVDGNLVITALGNITNGRYAGKPANATFTLLNLGSTLNSQCSSSTGVTSASGLSTLIISL